VRSQALGLGTRSEQEGGDTSVTKKIILLVLLAAFAVVVAEAFSQGPTTPASGAPGVSQPKVKSGDVSPAPNTNKSSPTASQTPEKSEKLPPAKDAAPAKTFVTSSSQTTPAASASSASTRKELVVERALVTLKDDNKLPASEAGMLVDVPVEEGQSVDKEQLVAQIDSRSTIAKQKIAEAELFAAEAAAANDAEVEVAEKAVEVSKAEWDQNEEIVKVNKRAVPLTELRKLKFQYEKSLAQVKQATNEKHIAGLTANAKRAQHEAASIELNLRQARAPFKGQVVEIMKKTGDWVTAGEPILHIVGLDQVRVKGFVLVSGPNGASQDDVIGKPVTIMVHSAGDKKHTVKGIVRFASPVIEGVGASRQFRIWADVDNEKTIDPVTKQESWKIQPGSMATMTIDLAPVKPVAAKSEPAKGKGKVEAYKPVTRER